MTGSVASLGRVLVTGGGGFIGARLLRWLERAGADMVGWTRADVDLLDGDAIADAMRRRRPDTIFHLAAAGVSPGRVFDVDVIRQDVTMVEHLTAHAGEGVRFLYAGTMSEYGRAGELAENSICTPHTAYGIAKLAGGLHAVAAGRRRGQIVRNARLFGVYGPGESPARLFPTLVEAMRNRRAVALSDGLPRRDFIHVDDACAAMVAIIASDTPHDVINVGTGSAVRVRDVAEWIADAAGAPRYLLGFGQRPRSPNDEELLLADVTRLEEVVGAAPPQRLAPGLPLDLFDDGSEAWPRQAERT